MAQGKISIQEREAKLWIQDVLSEIKNVQEIMRQVQQEMSTNIDDQDSVMKQFHEWGDDLKGYADKMCTGYRQATEKIQSELNKFFDKIREEKNRMRNTQRKIGGQ